MRNWAYPYARTRWVQAGEVKGDQAVRPAPRNKLSTDERTHILAV